MRREGRVSVLITAGGTSEDIDTVRSITNHATGRLGSLIADAFLSDGAKVTYLCGEASLLPKSRDCRIIKIRGVEQLAQTLDSLLKDNPYDCVIHSMAVSDYTPHAVTSVEEMAKAILRELCGAPCAEEDISARISEAILNGIGHPAEGKISSDYRHLIMVLKQTPKVISRIKALQPGTLLVGFKLLSGAPGEKLLEAGLGLVAREGCDWVLANDLSGISGDVHKAVLLDKSGIIREAGTKQEVARMIFEAVMERIEGVR